MSTSSELKLLGNTAFQSKDFENAIKYFSEAIELSPTDHVLYSNRSGAYASVKKWDLALKDAEKCVELAPTWPKGFSRQGAALAGLERYPEATTVYETGLKLDPQNQGLLAGLQEVKSIAASRIRSEQFDLQVVMALMKDPTLCEYVNEDPEYVTKVTSLARQVALSQDVGQLQLAMSVAADPRIKRGLAKIFNIPIEDEQEPAGKRTPSEPEPEKEEEPMDESIQQAVAAKEEGNTHYKGRRFEEALACYQKAQELNPAELLYVNNEAAVYLEQGLYDKCLATCDRALENKTGAPFSTVAKIYNRKAACYKKMGDLENAIEMYRQSLVEDNDRKIRTALRETERALEEKKRQDYIDPVKAEEHKERGNEFFRNKDYPAAKAEYDEAIKRHPSDAKLWSNRCAAYLQLLEYPSALKDADKATELDPTFVKGWSRKGLCHLKLKEHHKAIEAYNRGLAIDPQNGECQSGLAETMSAIRRSQASGAIDEEQVKRAMADPEIQEIMRDPQFQMILTTLQQDPSRLADYYSDPKVMNGLQKLMAAGIVRVG
eukprot:Protomagalhaensia_sp_Gyna_25__1027@NODE_1498_length_1785_cov_208_079038_g1213_i0_p1_GENE_NODE_1498_length_1785_cov_208_079038_g1213_i0NODE_1498_length_1785_cov_208_079038_g1213_i0_p1_ORF_typecomplete_len547_score152_08TPR_1/PF00515_28/1_4e05TPR_1/PF00515_28/0_81TPR_1/PF00515_28/0_035TPR_1/PF00515_28/7e06TPR_1/PF00515_28/0_19TPR_1/PF00515_28/1_3e05TPR_1/PF00515_28/0_0021TPR_1/PF00515_28/1_1e05TPR_1/PF00515_28/2_1e08TPR_2/PF07719_17/2_6e07TPR_2/PF07719_17/0_83TPR_2/PF07719_17/0_0033TPR_2/PF07719_1